MPEEEKVIAVTDKVQKLPDTNLKIFWSLKENNNDNKKGKPSNKRCKDKKGVKLAWKEKCPQAGKLWTKKVNKKMYNWYKWHKAWVMYDPNATSGPTTCKLRLAEKEGAEINT